MTARTVPVVPAIGAHTVATASAFVVIYGVTFAFFAPPAMHVAVSGLNVYSAQTASFTMLMLAALMVTVGATAFGAVVGRLLEEGVRHHKLSAKRAMVEFGSLGALLSLAIGAVFVALVASESGVTLPLVGGAALGLVIPGAVAAMFTPSVVEHVQASRKELIGTALAAVVVIGVVNYVVMGSLPSLTDLPHLFGV